VRGCGVKLGANDLELSYTEGPHGVRDGGLPAGGLWRNRLVVEQRLRGERRWRGVRPLRHGCGLREGLRSPYGGIRQLVLLAEYEPDELLRMVGDLSHIGGQRRWQQRRR
jgi:hypothetical protein